MSEREEWGDVLLVLTFKTKAEYLVMHHMRKICEINYNPMLGQTKRTAAWLEASKQQAGQRFETGCIELAHS
jgi:hypothetical protein